MDETDFDYPKAVQLLSSANMSTVVIDNNIFGETLTVFRNKKLDHAYFLFMELIKDAGLSVKMTNEKILKLATKFFIKYKKLSFIDALILAKAKTEKFELLTFDKALMKAWEEVR